ncbi:MAG: hypothetical protein M3277_02065 [Actinomycetota bacterium]|nr:hypothetical protein [Actinomycetota bacterium]
MRRTIVALAAVIACLGALVPGMASATSTCTILGTPAADVLKGTPAKDVICGLGGDDTIIGGDAADKLLGGAGDDLLKGGPAGDLLKGGPGDDLLNGGSGLDELIGGIGLDGCFPGSPDEILHGCEDVTAPRLKELGFDPATIDTSQGPQTFIVRARITDDLSGVSDGMGDSYFRVSRIFLRSPEGTSVEVFADFLPADVDGRDGNLVSGDPKDGVYEVQVTLPRYSPQGDWRVQNVRVEDEAGNGRYYFREHLEQLGLSTTFTQAGVGDSNPPQISSLEVGPTSVDTSAGPQTITATAAISDDIAGVQRAFLVFLSPERRQRLHVPLEPTSTPDVLSGTGTLVRYSMQGTWTLDEIVAIDHADNRLVIWGDQLVPAGFARSFEQTGVGDPVAPELVGFDFDPKAFDTRESSHLITVTARFTDMSGLNHASVLFSAPGESCTLSSCEEGRQSIRVTFYPTDLVEGSSTDGVYRSTVTLPQYAELGEWKLSWLQALDAVGNELLLIEHNPYGNAFMGGRNGEVAAKGFPVSFTNG